MYLGKVVGTVVSTSKDARLTGSKLLLVMPMSLNSKVENRPIVAVDSVGAGVGEEILYVQGSTAKRAVTDDNAPIDCVIVGIVDEVETVENILDSKSYSILDGEAK